MSYSTRPVLRQLGPAKRKSAIGRTMHRFERHEAAKFHETAKFIGAVGHRFLSGGFIGIRRSQPTFPFMVPLSARGRCRCRPGCVVHAGIAGAPDRQPAARHVFIHPSRSPQRSAWKRGNVHARGVARSTAQIHLASAKAAALKGLGGSPEEPTLVQRLVPITIASTAGSLETRGVFHG